MRRSPEHTSAVLAWTAATWLVLAAAVPQAAAQQSPNKDLPAPLREVGFEQRIGEDVPLDATFLDETGREVRLGDYFHDGKPVILALVYYECPMICNMVLNGISSSLGVLTFDPGKDFELVVVSFNPRETPELAAAKRENYLSHFARPETGAGWHFLTGQEDQIHRVTEAVGFRYTYDEKTGQYAHATGIMVLTPEGKISRYLFGIEYAPKDLRFALVESAQSHLGNVVDQLLLYCFHYDPATGRYGAAVMAILRLAGALTVAALVLFILIMRRREKRASHAPARGTA
jgi:protein SCO1/2